MPTPGLLLMVKLHNVPERVHSPSLHIQVPIGGTVYSQSPLCPKPREHCLLCAKHCDNFSGFLPLQEKQVHNANSRTLWFRSVEFKFLSDTVSKARPWTCFLTCEVVNTFLAMI